MSYQTKTKTEDIGSQWNNQYQLLRILIDTKGIHLTYKELTDAIENIGSSKKELEQLLNYSKNYLTSFTKKPIPKHLITTIKLLEVLHDNNIDFKSELKKMNLDKNQHKGGKFEKK